MKKTLLLILVLVILITYAGFQISRGALTTSINNRMDSSEALIVNEINGRIYRDFSMNKQPKSIEYSPDSFSYVNENGDRTIVSNSNEFTQIEVNYSDGTNWVGKAKGNIEVREIKEVDIKQEGQGDINVNLLSTKSKLYSITYRITEDFNKKRVSLNREFTSYFSVIDE